MTTDFLRSTARFVFFATLIIAPWAYGGTTALSIVVINWLLAAALLFWVTGLLLNRRPLKFPKALLIIIGLLLAIGAWMTINAHSIYDSEFGTFALISNPLPSAPGSADYVLSAAWMIRSALLLMSILFILDLSRDDRALLQLWQAIVVSGGSIALLGLLQKATGAGAIFWQTPIEHYAKTFFASYYYHANAGAYLNLVLPFSAGLAVRGFLTPSSQAARSLWLVIFLLNLAAIASNTSRGAQLIGGLLLILLMWQLGPRIFRSLSRGEKNVALAGLAAIILVLYAIGQASHLEQPISHWKQSEDLSTDARWLATQVGIKAIPKAGLFGYGPGTFRSVFPRLNADANNLAGNGTWRFLHQDYLQTVIEWGWLGSTLWAFLFFGGIVVGIRNLRQRRRLRRGQRTEGTRQTKEWNWRRRVILPMSIIALSGVALHSLVDFPMQIESIQLYVATCLGLGWGSARWNSAR